MGILKKIDCVISISHGILCGQLYIRGHIAMYINNIWVCIIQIVRGEWFVYAHWVYTVGQNGGKMLWVFAAGRCENNDVNLWYVVHIWTPQISFLVLSEKNFKWLKINKKVFGYKDMPTPQSETKSYVIAILTKGLYCRIWSWSPVPCEKHGTRDSVDTRGPCFSHGTGDHDQMLL